MSGSNWRRCDGSFIQMNALIKMKTCGPIVGVIVFVMFDG